MLTALIRALRPHQWTKNLLVFAPLVFAHRAGDPASWIRALTAYVIFCAASSAVYLINDLADRESDRLHPTKRNRPIASGALPLSIAWVAFAVLVGSVIAVSFTVPAREVGRASLPFIVWPGSYLLLNLAYTFWLKKIAVIDCICVALGFGLRVHAGAMALDGVNSSHWLLLCTFFFALFLAFCKRRGELMRQGEVEGPTRATMRVYDLTFLDQLIAPLAALSIASYSLYTVAPETVAVHGTGALLVTVPIVVFGVFRYLWLVHQGGRGEDPSRTLFTDPGLVCSGLLYGIVVAIVLGGRTLL